jgi:hypothetical protein
MAPMPAQSCGLEQTEDAVCTPGVELVVPSQRRELGFLSRKRRHGCLSGCSGDSDDPLVRSFAFAASWRVRR